MKITYFFTTLLVFIPLKPMYDPSSYKAEKITPMSLASFCQAPEKVKELVINFAERHKELIHILAKTTEDAVVDRAELKKATTDAQKAIERAGLKNYSKNNWIFKLPDQVDGKSYVAKLAGYKSIGRNILHLNGHGWGQWDKLTNDLTRFPSYQTPSSCAYALKAQEGKEMTGINFIEIPPTYCVQIPGRPDIKEGLVDGNCIVVQEEVTGAVPLIDNLAYIESLTREKHLAPLVGLVGFASLWDLKGNLLYKPETGQLALTDLEQPNNSKYFFQQNPDKHHHDIHEGIRGLFELFNAAAEAKYNVKQQKIDLLGLVNSSPYFRVDKKELINKEFAK